MVLLQKLFALAFCAFWAILITSATYKDLARVSELAAHGKVSYASVIGYEESERKVRKKRVTRTRTVHYHVLKYDGHITKLSLPDQQSLGQQLRIIYSVRDPTVYEVTKAQHRWWPLAKDVMGWFGLFFLPVIDLYFIYATFSLVKKFIFGFGDAEA